MSKPTRCVRCGRENDPGLAFCLDCGLAQPRVPPPAAAAPPAAPPASAAPHCAGCGARLQPTFRFCAGCGRPVPEPAGAPTPTPAREPVRATLPERTPAHGTRGAAAPAPGALRLTVVRGDGAPGPSFALDRPVLVCGRSEGELRLAEDPGVSPRHLRLTTAGAAVTAEDLGSLNGTFLRLRRAHRLGPGDELRVGRQVLRLEAVPRGADGGARPWGTRDAGHRHRLAQRLEGGGVGEVFPLHPGENLVGREAGDLAFPGDRYVSARHARVDVRDDEVVVTDLGSSNGTFVRLTGPMALGPGDQLLVGSQLLRVDGP